MLSCCRRTDFGWVPQIMELFEVPPDDVVSRKIFVDRIVEIFDTRRSLQLTLGDYEVRGARRDMNP